MVNFTVSYDYELFWGMHRNLKEAYVRTSISNANSAACHLFVLHEELNFPATWGVVGIAVDEPCREVEYATFLEHYKQSISADSRALFDHCIANTDLSSIHRLFRKLKESPLQEIGSHTYYHTFFDDHSPETRLARRDFEKFNEMSEREGICATSFICPKNIYMDGLRPLLTEFGFSIVRVNPDNALYSGLSPRAKSPLRRILRVIDFFLPINELFDLVSLKGTPLNNSKEINLKFSEATLFFRGATKYWLLNEVALLRYKFHCRLLIMRGKNIHLWTHPHNFGLRMNKSLRLFERYLLFAKNLEGKGVLNLKVMGDL